MQEIAKLNRHTKLFDTGQTDKHGKKIYRVVVQKGLHWCDGNAWQDFVPDWEFESGFGHKVKKADHNLRLYNKTKRKGLRFGFAKGVYVEYDLPNIEPAVSGNTMTFANAWQYCDLKYTAFPEGVKGDIVLKQPGHPASFQFPITLVGCTAQREGNSLVFYKNTIPVARIPAPYMEDAKGNFGEVTLTYDGTSVTFIPDAAWLSSAVYPVTIDPTTTLQPDGAAGIDSYVNSYAAGSNFGSSASMYFGDLLAGTRIFRSLIKFGNLSIPANATVNNAILSLYKFDGSDGDTNLGCHAINQAWDELTVTWSNQPLFNSTPETSVIVNTNGWYNWTITQLTINWLLGNPNYGVLIKAQNEMLGIYGYFYSSDYTDPTLRPKLVIDYTESAGTVYEGEASILATATTTGDGNVVANVEGSVSATAFTTVEGIKVLCADGMLTANAAVSAEGAVICIGEGSIFGTAAVTGLGGLWIDGEVAVVGSALITSDGILIKFGEGNITASAVTQGEGMRLAVGEGIIIGTAQTMAEAHVLLSGCGNVVAKALVTADGIRILSPENAKFKEVSIQTGTFIKSALSYGKFIKKPIVSGSFTERGDIH